MKIAIFEAEPREAADFDALKPGHDLGLTRQALRPENVSDYADSEIVSTFIYSRLDRRLLEQLPRLRLIATRSTGYDHIDTGYCAEHGITVSNVPTYGENTVAEHVFALLLTISHRLREAMERARSGRFSPQGLEGFDLQGKTLGVIGTGNIGRHVIRIAKGFAMEAVAFDVKPDAAAANELGFRYLSLNDLLATADVITLHVPAVPQTTHMIGAEAFSRLKPGAVLINTARGSIVEPRALIEALLSGRLAAAGLDVLPDEPLIREEAELISSIYDSKQDIRDLVADHVLLNMPNVVVTPHSAFNTREAIGRISATTVSNILSFLAGKPVNVVAAG